MKWNLAGLSLEEKVGQMFICGFDGLVPNDHAKDLIRKHKVGGIIYFRRNVKELSQLAKLSSSLQAAAAETGAGIPLTIAIDQEGGMVARIDVEGISRLPGNMALGAAGSTEYSYQTAKISGQELRTLGINMNFAPCLDVNNNPLNPVIGVRSYGEDPKAVAALGTAAITGFQEEGVSATAKHFPGHGDTSVDSHLGLASVPHSRDRLEQVELYPFREAIKIGVDAIMTAHVGFPAIEQSGTPATLSRAVLTGLLREELGFRGLIVTDCLEMHAIAKEFGVAEGAVRTIEAGADCVLVSHTLSEQEAAISAVIEAVASGRISPERIDASAERILALKERRAEKEMKLQPVELPRPNERVAEWLKEIAGKSITLVRHEGQLPLDAQSPVLVCLPELMAATQVDEAWSRSYTLGDALEARGVQVSEIRLGMNPDDSQIEEAVQKAERAGQIVMVSYSSGSRLPEGQRRLAERLLQSGAGRFIVASSRNPYDLNDIPGAPACLCCYENTPIFMEALAEVLLGTLKPEGSLPVSLKSGDGKFSQSHI